MAVSWFADDHPPPHIRRKNRAKSANTVIDSCFISTMARPSPSVATLSCNGICSSSGDSWSGLNLLYSRLPVLALGQTASVRSRKRAAGLREATFPRGKRWRCTSWTQIKDFMGAAPEPSPRQTSAAVATERLE
jgi:hypothetical protein